MRARVRKEVIVRGAVALLEGHRYQLDPEEAAALNETLLPYLDEDRVDGVNLAMGFLEEVARTPAPADTRDDAEEAADWLRDYLLLEAGLLTTEEHLDAENAGRDSYNAFCRELGEEPDPDAPFEFPRLLGPSTENPFGGQS